MGPKWPHLCNFLYFLSNFNKTQGRNSSCAMLYELGMLINVVQRLMMSFKEDFCVSFKVYFFLTNLHLEWQQK